MRPAEQLFNIRDLVRHALSEFGSNDLWFGHGTTSAWDEAVALVFGSLNLPLAGDDRLLDANLTMAERELLVRRIELRVKDRMPTPYILGKAVYHGLEFKVTQDTLIPRSPMGELLVQYLEPWVTREPARILDLCTGSGCLGILAAHVWPEAEVVLADISPEALAVAEHNIRAFGLEPRVTAEQSDLLGSIEGTFDLVLCNPPYVDAGDMQSLPAEYHHEPAMALASGTDGLEHWRRIFTDLPQFMNLHGVLVGEVGNSWPALEAQFPEKPFEWPALEGDGGIFVLPATAL